jgi:hypothetical protein
MILYKGTHQICLWIYTRIAGLYEQRLVLKYRHEEKNIIRGLQVYVCDRK